MPTNVVVARDPERALWRATIDGSAAGTARALRRPDGRAFVALRSVASDAYGPLLEAVTAELPGPLHANVRSDDLERLESLRAQGFEVGRRESDYVMPVAEACERLRDARLPDGYSAVRADQVAEDTLRELDDALRQDVPGTDGWRWDAEGFREETYDSDAFDPVLYLVAVGDASREHVGIARVWAKPDAPRLGLIAVSPAHRQRGVARGLLAGVFAVLAERGAAEVVTEIDDDNEASRSLLIGLGARRVGGFVEMVRRVPEAAAR